LVIAAFASWHEKHIPSRKLVDAGIRLIEHCALETYSVLTRLPPPHRAAGEIVRDFLQLRFSRPFLKLGSQPYRRFLLSLADRRIVGGAAYDALVAATAAEHDAELVSCDQRAVATYERFGVRFELL
jgi:predicted nucleic acid-binding protein